MTTLAEMFEDQDTGTFEERVAVVVAIVRQAADFAGYDQGLRSMFEAMCSADNETEFDQLYQRLELSLSENSARALQDA